MKRFYSTLLISAGALLSSCIVDGGIATGGTESAEVDILIATTGGGGVTRAQLDGEPEDAGVAAERRISTLDVLMFSSGKYLYRSEAALLPDGEGVYRVKLRSRSGTFDVHIFANSRDILDDYTDEALRGKSWAEVHALIVDTDPSRLVGPSPVDLPMYCYLPGQTLVVDEESTTPPNWPTNKERAMLRRSVASFDLFVQKNAATDRFVLEDLFVWNAPNSGAPGEIVLNAADHSALDYWYDYTTERYLVPAGMTTDLNAREARAADAGVDPPVAAVTARYHAVKTDDDVTVDDGTYQQIAYKMYVYDNPYRTTALGAAKSPTRLVMGGRYRTAEEVVGSGTPDAPETPAQWKKAYYPIDIVEGAEDNYRPVIRNRKYEFKVVGVSGPGYPDLESAANGATINLNVGVTVWNKDDAQIGVRGKYYVTMAEKEVSLWRYAGDERTLPLSYNEPDDGGGCFTLAFTKNAHIGEPEVVTNGNVGEYTIRNAFFEVKVVQNRNTKTA